MITVNLVGQMYNTPTARGNQATPTSSRHFFNKSVAAVCSLIFTEMPKTNLRPQHLANAFGEHNDLALHILRLRRGPKGPASVTVGYQNGRDEVLDGLVEGLNRDLSQGIDVRSIGDQQGRIHRKKGIEIRHHARSPMKAVAADRSFLRAVGEADDFAPVVNRFREDVRTLGT